MQVTTTALHTATIGNHEVRLVRYDGIERDRYKVMTYERGRFGGTYNARTISQCDSESCAWINLAALTVVLERHDNVA